MSEIGRDPYLADILNTLTEEQLKEILTMELMSEKTNVELIKRVNSVLEANSKQKMECDVDAKWREFVADYAGTEPLYNVEKKASCSQASKATEPRKLRFSFIAKTAAILVIVLMLGTVTAYAFGYDVFGAIATWTKETFSFTQQTGRMPHTSALSSRSAETTYLQAVLNEYGIREKLVPTYLPEGYEQAEFYVESPDDGMVFTAIYENMDNKIIIKIRRHISISNKTDYEKDAADPEIYEVNGISHYIMTNMQENYAVWIKGQYEVSLYGSMTKSGMTKMIDSVYKE